MEFTPINTQEEFDSRVTELYGDVTGLQQRVADLTGNVTTLTGERDTHAATIADLQKQIKGYQTADLKRRIAMEKGIPIQMADRLTGETEKDIRADADTFAQFVKASKPKEPHKSSESESANAKTAALKKMLNDMKGE